MRVDDLHAIHGHGAQTGCERGKGPCPHPARRVPGGSLWQWEVGPRNCPPWASWILVPRADYTPVTKASKFPGDAYYLLLSVRLRTSPWGSLHIPILFFFSFFLTQTLCRMRFEIDFDLDDKQSLCHWVHRVIWWLRSFVLVSMDLGRLAPGSWQWPFPPACLAPPPSQLHGD